MMDACTHMYQHFATFTCKLILRIYTLVDTVTRDLPDIRICKYIPKGTGIYVTGFAKRDLIHAITNI